MLRFQTHPFFSSQTIEEIGAHINRYRALRDADASADNGARTSDIKLPAAHKITAAQIDSISHTRRYLRRRNNLLENTRWRDTRAALETLSRNSLQAAQSMMEIDQARDVRIQCWSNLLKFEFSKRRLRQKHNQSLRTKRAWAKLGAAERRYVQGCARRRYVISR